MKKGNKLIAYILVIVIMFFGCSDFLYAKASPETTTITIDTQERYLLRGSHNLGNNIEMSLTSDEMWNANGKWMEQTYQNIQPRMMRWGYDAWAFDWEKELPLGPRYWGGNNSKDAEGSFGLREFIAFVKENDIIPFVMIPLESLEEFGGTTSLEKVKELTKSMAEYINEQGVEDAYFDMGNEVWNNGARKKAEYYGGLFKDFYEIIKNVNPNYKLVLQRAPENILWRSYNKKALEAAGDYYDAYDDHRYAFYDWNKYFDFNKDQIFTPGSELGNKFIPNANKIAIMGELNIGWTKWPGDWKTGHVYDHGGSLALLNGVLNLIDTNKYDYLLTWPSHWPSEKAIPGNTKHPFGLFNMDDWELEKDTTLFSGPIMAHRIINQYVDEYRVYASSDNPKVRVFAYENRDKSKLTLIVINKWNDTKLNLILPSKFSHYSSMELTADSVYDVESTWSEHNHGVGVISDLQDDVIHYEGVTVYQFYTEDTTSELKEVEISYPQNGAEEISTLPTFQWENESEVKNYKLTLSENPDLSEPIVMTHTGQTNCYQIMKQLKRDTVYYWSIQAVSTTNQSPQVIYQFTTSK